MSVAAARHALLLALVLASPAADAVAAGTQRDFNPAVALPTPLRHYEEFDVEAAARALLPRLALRLDPATLQRFVATLGPDPLANPPSLSADEVIELLERIDLEPFLPQLIELLLHSSRVLELVPEDSAEWLPLVHDSLLVVLNGMSIDRIRDRIAGQAALPPDADRGDRMLAFGAETPTFQKIGQILARSAWLPEDLRAPLQTLESDISTTAADALIAVIEEDLGEETLRAYDFVLDDEVLSEASVGAVIGATIVPPGESRRERVVVKVIKAYAIAAITEDLRSIDTLVTVLEDNRDFYGIGATPLVDMFEEVRSSLAREIEAADERTNLRNARSYFAEDPRVVVPWVCDCSSEHVTVMERIEGVKVTEAYPGDAERRRKLADRLADIALYDVMFGPGDTLFHGDPHAGNVFFIGDAEDPYRIALLDWGLQGTLGREQRAQLVQVGLGLQLKHADRLRDNVGGLVRGGVDLRVDGDKVDAVIGRLFSTAEAIRQETGEDPQTLALLDRLVSELAGAGFAVDGDILLYVKAVYTIEGVVSDLDPDFDAGDYVAARVRNQILAELPRRLANTVWVPGMWTHDYDSMASNNDVWASALNSIGLRFESVGAALWRGISFPFR